MDLPKPLTRQQSRKQSTYGENNYNYGTMFQSHSPVLNYEIMNQSSFGRFYGRQMEASPGVFRQQLSINKGLSTFSDNNQQQNLNFFNMIGSRNQPRFDQSELSALKFDG
jgi:hypothetical protein